ncbi:MAG: hypothetical protein HRU15_08285 [Planctomycetes bacterium]|nr:hypothetical protein [Planctomycetota bacterium]
MHIQLLLLSIGFTLFASCNQRPDSPDNSAAHYKTSYQLESYIHKDALYTVNCGARENYIDQFGHLWLADQKYSADSWGHIDGTGVQRKPMEIDHTDSDYLFQNERYAFTAYKFAVKNGSYTVICMWAETYGHKMKAGARAFDVVLENKAIAHSVDIFAQCNGMRKPLILEFQCTVTDGVLDVDLDPVLQNTMINAIAVIKN